MKQTNHIKKKRITVSRPRLTVDELNAVKAMRGEKGNTEKAQSEKEAKYDELAEMLSTSGMFESYSINPHINGDGNRETVALLQYSDQHIDEVVESDSVMGLNEYNPTIAEKRNELYFYKAAKLIRHHQAHYNIKRIVLAMQGDAIGGWIHPELEQTNSLSPNEAIYKFKGMAVAGIEYLSKNVDVEEITVVCICGNHSRETKKTQFSNFTDTNKEYWMYLDIKSICESLGLSKVKFIIPKAEMAIVDIFDKRYLFAHGHQFRYAGGVGGIFPSMLRWFANITKSLKIDAAFIGHWHTSIMTRKVIVNASMKGYDAFSIGRGFEFERPSQNLILIDSKYDICLFQQIYLDENEK